MSTNTEDPIAMYLVVRQSLNMSIGKTAAQVAHASSRLTEIYYRNKASTNNEYFDNFKSWLKDGERKIVLEADEKEWKTLQGVMNNYDCLITDAGHTELEPGTTTVIGFFPMKKSARPNILKRLQALK